MKYYLLNLFRGLVLGSSMLLPGVSGGTMAVLLGVYDKLVHAVASLRRNIKKSLTLLSAYLLGGIAGVLLFSRLVLNAMEMFEFPMLYLFLGAIAGSVPMLYKKASAKELHLTDFLFVFIGIGVVLALDAVPKNLLTISEEIGLWNMAALFIAGIVFAVGFVLPGISASYMLLVLGIYESTFQAVYSFNLPYLIPFLLGSALGVVLTAKILDHTMKKHPRGTYFVIMGFVLGSLASVFPGLPQALDILWCILTLAAGFTAVFLLGRGVSDK